MPWHAEHQWTSRSSLDAREDGTSPLEVRAPVRVPPPFPTTLLGLHVTSATRPVSKPLPPPIEGGTIKSHDESTLGQRQRLGELLLLFIRAALDLPCALFLLLLLLPGPVGALNPGAESPTSAQYATIRNRLQLGAG